MKLSRLFSALIILTLLILLQASAMAEGIKRFDDGSEHVDDKIRNDKTRTGNRALHEEFAPIGPDLEALFTSAAPWMSGYAFGSGETFNSSLTKGVNVFGSNADEHDYVPVEIRF